MLKTYKTIAAAVVLSLIILLIFPPTAGFASSKARTYKVGANVMFGISKTDAGYSGLACDYLNAISKYTGDKFTYVDGTEEELFRMLKSGEIDLIPCVTETERAYFETLLGGSDGDTFKATRNAIVSRFGAIYVYDKGTHGDIVLNDVSAIRRMNIGYLVTDKPRYFDGDALIYSELEGASFVSYNTESVMQSDLVSGKIDAVVKDCLRPWANETVAYQFPAKRGFFVTRTDDKLADKLESGLTPLFRDQPTFYGDIYKRYIANYGSQKFAYNAQESEFIKTHNEITMAFNLEADVMKCYNTKKGTLDGVVGLLVEKYTETTGLKVNIKPYNNLAECLSALGGKDVDLVYGGVHTADTPERQGYYVTAPAINFPLVLAGKANAELRDTMKIAVDSGNNEAISSLARFYPEANIIYSEDVGDGCDMAVKGTCSVMCLTGYDAMYLKSNGYPDLNIKKVLPVYSTQCFAARPEDKGLIGVTETALIKINGSEIIANIYNMLEVEEYSAPRFGVRLWLVMTIVAVLAVVAAGVITLIILENKRRSEIDPLTGGLTKRVFLDTAAKTVKKSGSVRWATILFDIDKFKFINDRLGYEEGNRMLERLYKTLGDHMEKGETFARMSDDNFVCCIRDASDEEITSRLKSIFDEFARRNSLFVSYPVVFSAGVCRLEQCVE
ncbi:MAG: transporter substrate-binding domain-containing protein, partial [Oscillospiraceae bacterium]|nr:transporter substrate-binding domain-containing protein [Oscillospiraceae bacterium]